MFFKKDSFIDTVNYKKSNIENLKLRQYDFPAIETFISGLELPSEVDYIDYYDR